MIYKKKSLKNKVKKLSLWLFLFFALTIVVNTPAKAQELDRKTGVKTITTLNSKNDTVVLSQIQLDSISSDVSYFPKGLHGIFAFLKENINYLPKAIEMKKQGDIIVGFTITQSGNIVNSRIVKGLSPDLDKEVLRCIKEMPEWGLTENNVDYKINVNFALPDGNSISKPEVSVVGLETSNLKLTVKRMEGINYGSMTVYGISDAGGDSLVTKTISIMSKDVDR